MVKLDRVPKSIKINNKEFYIISTIDIRENLFIFSIVDTKGNYYASETIKHCEIFKLTSPEVQRKVEEIRKKLIEKVKSTKK